MVGVCSVCVVFVCVWVGVLDMGGFAHTHEVSLNGAVVLLSYIRGASSAEFLQSLQLLQSLGQNQLPFSRPWLSVKN